MNFTERILSLIEQRGITKNKLLTDLGLSKNSFVDWQKRGTIPNGETLSKLAEYFNVSTDYLLGNENLVKSTAKSKGVRIPVLGEVQAGLPIEAIEDIIDYEEIDENMASQGEYFGLQVRGNSMEPRFVEGDVVIVKQQTTVDNGDIAIMLINGDSATIKKFIQHENGISLIAFNQVYSPMFYTNKEIEELPVICLGKVVELRAKF